MTSQSIKITGWGPWRLNGEDERLEGALAQARAMLATVNALRGQEGPPDETEQADSRTPRPGSERRLLELVRAHVRHSGQEDVRHEAWIHAGLRRPGGRDERTPAVLQDLYESNLTFHPSLACVIAGIGFVELGNWTRSNMLSNLLHADATEPKQFTFQQMCLMRLSKALMDQGYDPRDAVNISHRVADLPYNKAIDLSVFSDARKAWTLVDNHDRDPLDVIATSKTLPILAVSSVFGDAATELLSAPIDELVQLLV